MNFNAPLLKAMEKYRKAKIYPLHTPGHKGGRGAEAYLQKLLGQEALSLDVSLMSELDDIHNPQTCLKAAQQLAAQLYGADASFFAPNGTTGAIHAMLLGALQPGAKVLIPRNAHRSVVGALVLGGFVPVYVVPEFSARWTLSLQITAEAVEKTLAAEPSVKAVVLTSPNYYGLAADVAAIAQITHAHQAVLLVDEAHGAHLGFSEHLPPSALSCGADAVAQSTHKILGALTQCSMLHVKGERLDLSKMQAAMSLLTTTSPNYLLLASLDAARSQMAAAGKTLVEKALSAAEKLRNALASIPGVRLVDKSIIGQGGVAALDFTKVTAQVTGLGVTGPEAAAALRQAGVAVELVDRDKVLFLITYADANAEFDHIITIITKTLRQIAGTKALHQVNFALPSLPRQRLTPRQAFFARRQVIPFAQAAGQISAEQISFYPPGIPVLVPGEEITQEIIEYCQQMLALGIAVSGPYDGTLQNIEVLKE